MNSTETFSGISYRISLEIYIWIHVSSEYNIKYVSLLRVQL
jgi:hypothetical protein